MDARRYFIGAMSKSKGANFEKLLEMSFDWYKQRGDAMIEKTPEPMRVIRPLGKGRFEAFYEKKAQPDYKGVLNGGRSIIFEAKYTDKDRALQSIVHPHQLEYMKQAEKLGALCFIVLGFGSGAVYKVPIDTWENMKDIFGHKYVTEKELTHFRVKQRNNSIAFLL